MYRLLNRQLYLWQGILIYGIFSVFIIYLAFYLNNNYFAPGVEPISKIDLQMTELQNKTNKNAEDYNYLGSIYLQKKAIQDAKQAFIKSISLRKNYSDAYFNLGTVYLEEGNQTKAEKNFLETLRLDDTRDVARLSLAKIYIDNSEYDDAEKMLLEAKDTYSSTADYYYYLALVYQNTGDKVEAKNNFEMALSFDPEYQEAKEGLQNLLRTNHDDESKIENK